MAEETITLLSMAIKAIWNQYCGSDRVVHWYRSGTMIWQFIINEYWVFIYQMYVKMCYKCFASNGGLKFIVVSQCYCPSEQTHTVLGFLKCRCCFHENKQLEVIGNVVTVVFSYITIVARSCVQQDTCFLNKVFKLAQFNLKTKNK